MKIRAGSFYAVLVGDGYEVRHDEFGLVSRVEFPLRLSRDSIKRDATADVAARYHQHRAAMRAAVEGEE